MGQVPPKYMMPSAPYGQSDAVNAVNAVQPQAMNPQTPLLPPNFTNPGQGASVQPGNVQAASTNPFSTTAQQLPGPLNQNPIVRSLLPYSF